MVNTSAAKSFLVSISYPPLDSPKGNPFLSQNRQFQWTNTGNVIYPVIAASAATILSGAGYQVFWDDAIAEKLDYQTWFNRLIEKKPNLVVIETKTPVVKKHWEIIKKIKKSLPKTIVVLIGDHVTALPEESLLNSPVDYILTGGDYDFMLLNLVKHITDDTTLEPGFYYHSKVLKLQSSILNSGKFALKHHLLDKLPIIDRQLTNWQNYAYNNTNYKHKPGAYIMSGRDCWWGKCSFCSWTTLFPGKSYRRHSVDHVLSEIENLVNNFHVKEIFDDAGTLPVGPWLDQFCHELIKRGLNKKVTLGCNMRFGALKDYQYDLLKKAGFRFLLYGLESSNQKTLDKINKNSQTGFVKKDLIQAKKVGLEPHITVMIGYPWETKKDITNTLDLARNLFRNCLVDSLQATVIIPYPGTPLFDYCQKNKLLLTTDWDKYDMRQSIIKSPVSTTQQKLLIRNLFKGALSPKFLFHKIISIRSLDDVRFLSNYAIKYLQKLHDFS